MLASLVQQWTAAGSGEIAMVVLSTIVIYVAILVYTRISGLRSFSKMSASDFAMTIAVGSLFASTISSPQPSLAVGMVSIAALFIGQWLLAWLRKKSERFSKVVDNQPLLLMVGKEFIEENLHRSNVTRDDVYGKLREANALNFEHVLAVVFETTGDISVLHSDDPDAYLEPAFFQNVRGSERLQLSDRH